MKAIIPKAEITNTLVDGKKIKFQKNYLYIFSDQMAALFKEMIERQGLSFEKFIKCVDLDEIIKPFNFQTVDKGVHKVLLIRSGAIGDLIAISALQYFLERNGYDTSFITLEKFLPVLNWFYCIPAKLNFYTPIARYKFINDFKFINQISLQGIVDNTRQNWYEVIAAKAGVNFFEGLGRPKLKNIPEIVLAKGRILISPRSSTIIRSMRFIDIYQALKEILNIKDFEIYVFKSDLSIEDMAKIPDDIVIIGNMGLEDYLKALSSFSLVISVDTAAIHLREGIKKPAIGIFNAMTAESRTKYYKYTHSFDIKSPCPFQPCFLHNTTGKDQVCQIATPDEDIAPCLNSDFTTDLHEQLVRNMSGYIKTTLKLLKS